MNYRRVIFALLLFWQNAKQSSSDLNAKLSSSDYIFMSDASNTETTSGTSYDSLPPRPRKRSKSMLHMQ